MAMNFKLFDREFSVIVFHNEEALSRVKETATGDDFWYRVEECCSAYQVQEIIDGELVFINPVKMPRIYSKVIWEARRRLIHADG